MPDANSPGKTQKLLDVPQALDSRDQIQSEMRRQARLKEAGMERPLVDQSQHLKGSQPKPGLVSKSLHFTDKGSNTLQRFLESPSPSDMNFDDFVMLRRKRETNPDESDIHPLPRAEPAKPVTKTTKMTTRSAIRGKGKQRESRWVRFLDVALTCPSDESDDELLFLPAPSTSKRKTSERKA